MEYQFSGTANQSIEQRNARSNIHLQSDDKSYLSGYSRTLTFTRQLTFDSWGMLGKRPPGASLGDPILNNEEAWTKRLLESYNEINKEGNEGDIPIPAAFASVAEFWKTFFMAAATSTLIGLVSLGFLNLADKTPRIWANNWQPDGDDDFFSCNDSCNLLDGCKCQKYLNCDFYGGHAYWTGVTVVTGFIIGSLRYIMHYPGNLPGLFREILSYHVEPKWAPATVVLSAISLAGGASLGPEQALSNLGGGIATYLRHRIHFHDEDYGKLLVLAGMASALGALFPTPLLAVLMLHELGEPPKTYMEATLIMAAGAIPAFLVYYGLVNDTFIESLSANGAVLAVEWSFNEWNCGTAILIGIVSAPLGLFIFLIVGICKQIFNRIRLRLRHNRFLLCMVPPVLAGVCIGSVNYALPLTIGNGSMVISSIVGYGAQGYLSNKLLVCSIVAKMFVLGVSMNGGFVGGFIFPILTIGIMTGVLCHQLFNEVPLGLSVGCFLAALPSSVCPMPFTLSGLSIFCFYFGLYQTAPVFLSAIVSYTLVCGSGVFGRLLERGQAQTNATNKAIDEVQHQQQQKQQPPQAPHQQSPLPQPQQSEHPTTIGKIDRKQSAESDFSVAYSTDQYSYGGYIK